MIIKAIRSIETVQIFQPYHQGIVVPEKDLSKIEVHTFAP